MTPARAAIDELTRSGEQVGFQAVARRAGVSRQWLYTRPELRTEIQRSYAARRTQEGKTKREIIRCLKRYIAPRATTHSRPTSPTSARYSPATTHAIAITCGAGFIGRHHRRIVP